MRDAQVLILDEPTAALDARSEFEVFQRFKELSQGKTAVLISHRFSSVRMADRILVLADGTVEAAGTHEELLRAAGALRRAVRAAGRRVPLMNAHVTVIGAGVVGLACATHLQIRGHAVTVVDPRAAGRALLVRQRRLFQSGVVRAAWPAGTLAAGSGVAAGPVGTPGRSLAPRALACAMAVAVPARVVAGARQGDRRCAALAADRDARQVAAAGGARRRAGTDRPARLRIRL